MPGLLVRPRRQLEFESGQDVSPGDLGPADRPGGAGDHHSAEDPGEGGREERILFGEPDQEGEGGESGEY